MDLERAVAVTDSIGTAESLFRLLYGAPTDPIIDIGTAALRQYRPTRTVGECRMIRTMSDRETPLSTGRCMGC
jgi:hypothetical protein